METLVSKRTLQKRKKARIEIAQEALYAVNNEILVPSCDIWLGDEKRKDLVNDKTRNKDLKSVLQKSKNCKACAMGGLFAAAVLLHNKMPISKINIDTDGESDLITGEGWDLITDYLSKFFSPESMKWIEYTFENGKGAVATYWYSLPDGISQEMADLTEEFVQRFKKPKDRFVAIMQNIVRNGDFKLEKVVM